MYARRVFEVGDVRRSRAAQLEGLESLAKRGRTWDGAENLLAVSLCGSSSFVDLMNAHVPRLDRFVQAFAVE